MAYQDRKVIVCIPCGSEKFLKVLLPYVLGSSSGLIDEVYLWINTTVESDLSYIRKVQRAFPQKIKCWALPPDVKVGDEGAASYFYRTTTNPRTIYFKLDDDICYVHPEFFKAACDELLQNEKSSFAVLCNAFNTPITTKIHQDNMTIADGFGRGTGDAACSISCNDGDFAKEMHVRFLNLAAMGQLKDLYFGSFNVVGKNHSVAMCYAGETFSRFNGEIGADVEKEIAERIPQALGMSLRICGKALCSHFAFPNQLSVLDSTNTLARYEQISLMENGELRV